MQKPHVVDINDIDVKSSQILLSLEHTRLIEILMWSFSFIEIFEVVISELIVFPDHLRNIFRIIYIVIPLILCIKSYSKKSPLTLANNTGLYFRIEKNSIDPHEEFLYLSWADIENIEYAKDMFLNVITKYKLKREENSKFLKLLKIGKVPEGFSNIKLKSAGFASPEVTEKTIKIHAKHVQIKPWLQLDKKYPVKIVML